MFANDSHQPDWNKLKFSLFILCRKAVSQLVP